MTDPSHPFLSQWLNRRPFDAEDAAEELLREARADDSLMRALRQILSDTDVGLPLCRTSDEQVVAQLGAMLARGVLFPQRGAYAQAATSTLAIPAQERGALDHLQSKDSVFMFEGRELRFAAAALWHSAARDIDFHVVGFEESRSLIARMQAGQALSSEQRNALGKASALLARPGVTPDKGLLLLRRNRHETLVAAGKQEAFTPSQLRAASSAASAIKHWIEIHLVQAPDSSPPKWWPKSQAGPYPNEPFVAEITDGHKEGKLDKQGAVRYDDIPAGQCSIQFKQGPGKKGGNGPGKKGGGGPAPPKKCPEKVQFKEFADQDYGWDDHSAAFPWKSVEKGEKDKVRANIKLGGGDASLANFVSSDPANVQVSPAAASGVKEILTLTGVSVGESQIDAECCGGRLGKMKVKTYSKRTRTVAVRLVHGKGWQKKSTDVSDADISKALHKVYRQAVVEFKLTRLPEMTVDFDLNKDGKIDVNTWMSAEMAVVCDVCKDDAYDFNIFLVDNPSDGSTGFMMFNQRYGFIHAGLSTNPGQTIAHELGHGQGLQHAGRDKNGGSLDPVNVMEESAEAAAGEFKKWRLRKPQWDQVNP